MELLGGTTSTDSSCTPTQQQLEAKPGFLAEKQHIRLKLPLLQGVKRGQESTGDANPHGTDLLAQSESHDLAQSPFKQCRYRVQRVWPPVWHKNLTGIISFSSPRIRNVKPV